MIRTIQPQVLDALNRVSAVAYIEAENRREPDGVVIFDTVFKVLDVEYRQTIENVVVGQNEEGGDIIEQQTKTFAHPYFKTIYTREARYKKSTFYGVVGNPSPSQYDDVMIAQIAFVNGKVWTGNELQKVYYWELTANDLEKVTEQEIATLLTPYEVTI